MILFFFRALIYVSCIVAYGAVIVIDTAGLYLILKKRSVDFVYSLTGITQPLIWIGWVGIVIGLCGTLYLTTLSTELLYQFILLGILGLNGVYLHRIKQKIRDIKDNSELPVFSITLATSVSQISWLTFLFLQISTSL